MSAKKYIYDGKKPEHISHSQIEAGRCLYYYMRTRLAKDVSIESEPMRKGSLVHNIIHKYTDYCVKHRMDSDYEVLKEIFETEFNNAKLEEDSYIEMRDIVYRFGEKDMEVEKINDFEKKEVIEFSPGKYITVIIDRTNAYETGQGTGLEVIDFKNSMILPTKDDVNNHKQLRLYRWAAMEYLYPGFEVVRTAIHNTRYNFIRFSDWASPMDLIIEFDNIAAFVSRQYDRLLHSKEYNPTRCAICTEYSGCPLINECGMWSKKEIDGLKNKKVDDRVRLLRYYKSQLTEIEWMVKKELKDVNPIAVDEKEAGFISSVGYSYDMQKFFNYCKERSISLEGYTIGKTIAEKVMTKGRTSIKKMRPDQIAELEAMRVPEGSNRFKI